MPSANSRLALRKKRLGLALGGGAARGIAHVGVLKALERRGILPQMMAGTSMGALVGALYAKELDANQVERYAIGWSRWKVAQLLDPTLPRIGLIKGRKVEDILESLLGEVTFSDLRMPFACIAADIETGEEVVIREGLVAKAVRASISIPGIFVPVEGDGRFLVDGGLVNPVPVSTLREMGADFVIAVNVIPDPGERVRQQGEEEEPRSLNIFGILMQTIHVASCRVVRASLKGADIVIEPDVGHIGAADFHRAEECISEGLQAAERTLSALNP